MAKLKFLLLILIVMMTVGGCSNSKDASFNELEDLNKPEYTIGAVVGTASEPYVGEVFPNAVEKQFQDVPYMIVALEQKQVDGVVFTRASLESVLAEKSDEFKILDQAVAMTDIYAVISPNTKLENLRNELNEFLRAKKADGTLEKVHKYWFVEHKTEMPAVEKKPPRQKN